MLIFYHVVQGEAYKWDWGLPPQSQCGWKDTKRIYLIHPCIMDDLPPGAEVWTETHCLFVKGCLRSSTLVSGREWGQEKAVLV